MSSPQKVITLISTRLCWLHTHPHAANMKTIQVMQNCIIAVQNNQDASLANLMAAYQ